MTVQLSDWGVSLGSRSLGSTIRKHLVQRTHDGSCIDISCANVLAISNAFADECFGKLIADRGFDDFRRSFHFVHVSASFQAVILNAINLRLSLPPF